MEERRLWRDLIVAFQYLKGAYKQEGERLFTGVDSDRTKGSGFKLRQRRFWLDVRRKKPSGRKLLCCGVDRRYPEENSSVTMILA